MIAVASARVACTTTGEIAFGRMCEERIARRGTPIERAARTKSLSRCARIEPRISRVKIGICVTPTATMIWTSPAEHRDDADREQEPGNGEHDVGEAHDHAVDEPADVARDRAEDHSDGEADRDRDDADQQRVAGPVDDARELVSPERVDAEPMVERRAGQQLHAEPREILEARILRREQRREDGDEDEHAHQREAEQRTAVPAEPRPRVAPEPAAAGLERRFPGLDLGDAQLSLIRGLRKPYGRRRGG